MMDTRPAQRDRIAIAAVVAAIHLALGYALLTCLGVTLPPAREAAPLLLFRVPPPGPEPAPTPPKPASERRSPLREGAAAPANVRSRPKETTAPPPVIRVPLPPPLFVPRRASTGPDLTQGAAPVPGPGSGAGGEGTGTGSGRQGSGPGGGGDGGTPPRHIAGRIRDADYPGALAEAGIGGTVGVRYIVQVNGRVTDCAITRSSGSAALDDFTCALIEKRFRFRPSRDRSGRPVPAIIVENHSWIIEEAPPPEAGAVDVPQESR